MVFYIDYHRLPICDISHVKSILIVFKMAHSGTSPNPAHLVLYFINWANLVIFGSTLVALGQHFGLETSFYA